MIQLKGSLILVAILCIWAHQANAIGGRRLKQNTNTTNTIKICMPIEIKDINECNSVVQLADDTANGISFSCISGGTVTGCVRILKDGLAQIAKLPASGIYEADKADGAKPFVSEFFSDTLGKYTEGYTVAVVSSDFCYSDGGNLPPMTSLKKKNACFGGFATDSGWNVPVGTLYNEAGLIPAENSTRFTEDAQSVLNYFKDICAPGYYASSPRFTGGKVDNMCSLCSDAKCSAGDTYWGNDAAYCASFSDIVFLEYPLIQDDQGAGSLSLPSPTQPPPAPTPPSPSPDASAVAAVAGTGTAAAGPAAGTAGVLPVDSGAAPPPKDENKKNKSPKPKKDDNANADNAKDGNKKKNNGTDTAPENKKKNNNTTADATDGTDTAAPDTAAGPTRKLMAKNNATAAAAANADPALAEDPTAAADPNADPTLAEDPTAAADPNADPTLAEDPTAAADPNADPALAEDPTATADPNADPALAGNTAATTNNNAAPTSASTARTPGVDPLADKFLYCPQKSSSCTSLANYKECNLARVPSQAFVAMSDFLKGPQGDAAKNALLNAGTNAKFMNEATKVGTVPFVLITKGTTALTPVDVSVGDYLGSDFTRAMAGVDNIEAVYMGTAVGGGGGGGGLSTTAIIVISVVCGIVFLTLVAVGIAYYYKHKRESGWKKYQDAVKDIRRI